MRNVFISQILVSITLLFHAGHALTADLGATIATKATKALGNQIRITKNISGTNWMWLQAKMYDETYPLTIDVVVNKTKQPTKVIYLLSGSGLSFESSFFTPQNDNLAHYLRNAGYLVIGITPRESSVPTNTKDLSFMAAWGARKHKMDIRKVISSVSSAINSKYDILGLSAGAGYAIDYAASYNDTLDKIIILDIPSFNPNTQAAEVSNAKDSHNALKGLLTAGTFADDSVVGFKSLIEAASYVPNDDSGVSRGVAPGNFTINGLLHFSTIFTGILPGLQTPVTGRSDNWDLVQGYFAGSYDFALDPLEDHFSWQQVDLPRIAAIISNNEGGLYPLADARDFSAQEGFVSGAYAYQWKNIKQRVVWVNSELGYGSNQYGANLIKNAGNKHVKTYVVPNYAHGDVVWGRNAKRDVWPLFLIQP